MGRIVDSVNALTSLMRTLLLVAIVGGVGWAGFFAYETWFRKQHEADLARQELNEANEKLVQAGKELAEKAEEIDRLNKRVDKLETARRLLKMDRRLADIEVLSQELDEKTGQPKTTSIRFSEVSEGGKPLGEPLQVTLTGDMVYIDYLVVKFEDKYVEEHDLDRHTSLCLLRRIYSEKTAPENGVEIDKPGQPVSYNRGQPVSDFERKIWTEFWQIANSDDKAKQLGVRAAHGQAPNIKLQKGKKYKLHIRASGDPWIGPAEDLPATNSV